MTHYEFGGWYELVSRLLGLPHCSIPLSNSFHCHDAGSQGAGNVQGFYFMVNFRPYFNTASMDTPLNTHVSRLWTESRLFTVK